LKQKSQKQLPRSKKTLIDASILLPCVNTLYESNRYESHTKKKSVCLEDAHLSILAASTVQTYERTWDASFTDIGFNNRLFIVPDSAGKKFSFPAKIPESDKLELKRQLSEVLAHVGNFLELEITPEARAIYDGWYLNLERSIHAKRLDTYAMRFMCLLAADNLKTEIDEEVVNQAIDLCDWQLQVRKIHDPIDADNATAKMEEKIRRAIATGPMSDRDLKRKTNANRSGLWFYNTARSNLERAGEIAWNKKIRKWKEVL
jgi:hypothetical protein